MHEVDKRIYIVEIAGDIRVVELFVESMDLFRGEQRCKREHECQ